MSGDARPSFGLLDLADSITAQIPSLDDPTLGLVDVVLVRGVLDADADAVLCEDDVLLAHALRRGLLDLVDGEIHLPKHPGNAGEEEEGNDEGDDLSMGLRAKSQRDFRILSRARGQVLPFL